VCFCFCAGFRVDMVLCAFVCRCFVAHPFVSAFSLRCLRWGWFVMAAVLWFRKQVVGQGTLF